MEAVIYLSVLSCVLNVVAQPPVQPQGPPQQPQIQPQPPQLAQIQPQQALLTIPPLPAPAPGDGNGDGPPPQQPDDNQLRHGVIPQQNLAPQNVQPQQTVAIPPQNGAQPQPDPQFLFVQPQGQQAQPQPIPPLPQTDNGNGAGQFVQPQQGQSQPPVQHPGFGQPPNEVPAQFGQSQPQQPQQPQQPLPPQPGPGQPQNGQFAPQSLFNPDQNRGQRNFLVPQTAPPPAPPQQPAPFSGAFVPQRPSFGAPGGGNPEQFGQNGPPPPPLRNAPPPPQPLGVPQLIQPQQGLDNGPPQPANLGNSAERRGGLQAVIQNRNNQKKF